MTINKYIKIFATGGTFDKEYNEINGELFFKQTHLDLLKYEQILAKYTDLITINFCGNHGDPMMHPEIVKLSAILIRKFK